jgi:hypothetical protein
MSEGRSTQPAAKRMATGTSRVLRAWRTLPRERRPAAYAALALFVTLFLPWYQETGLVNGRKLQTTSASLTGWAAFSWVEAAVLLVAVSVLVLLFQRAEGRAFHLPGGDGVVITAAGCWTCVLIVWRIFDKQGVTTAGQFATTSGIEWGIFVALAVAAWLAYAGSRIRAAHRPEPPLPGEAGAPEPAPHLRRRARQPRGDTVEPSWEPATERSPRLRDQRAPRLRDDRPDPPTDVRAPVAVEEAREVADEQRWPEPSTEWLRRGRPAGADLDAPTQPADAPTQPTQPAEAPTEPAEAKAEPNERPGEPAPSTQAGRSRRPAPADDQLKIPLEDE